MIGGETVLLRLSREATLNGENYAVIAERVMAEPNGNGQEKKLRYPRLTVSKLRRIYALIMNIYTKINTPSDFDRRKADLQYLKVKMAYESGRDQDVKSFIDGTALMMAIDHIKDYDTFVLYCRYAESLVAYFKFYGGRD